MSSGVTGFDDAAFANNPAVRELRALLDAVANEYRAEVRTLAEMYPGTDEMTRQLLQQAQASEAAITAYLNAIAAAASGQADKLANAVAHLRKVQDGIGPVADFFGVEDGTARRG